MRSKKYLNRLNESNVEKICNMVIDRRLEEMKLDEGLGNLGKTARNLAVAGLIGLGSHGHAAAQPAAQAPQQHTTTIENTNGGESQSMDDLLYECMQENTRKFFQSFSEEEHEEFNFFLDYLEEHDNIRGVYKIKYNGTDWAKLGDYRKEVAKIARQLNREKKLNDYILIESDGSEYGRFVPKSLVKKYLALYINAGLE